MHREAIMGHLYTDGWRPVSRIFHAEVEGTEAVQVNKKVSLVLFLR